jgi:hypothetical protein
MPLRKILSVPFAYFAATLPLALTASLANAATISSGYSGMWYDPARSGEGLQLDVMDDDTAVVYWFTYDDSGKQRWFGGVGQIVHGTDGDTIQFPDMYVTQGGQFGPSFNPADVKFQTVGNISLTFGDCNAGTFKYTAFGQSQTLPIQRLTQTMGAGCQSINGVPGEPVQAYAGQSGNWYDVSHNGEGFDLHWMSNGQAIVSWYTYDTSGNQVWLMGVGIPQNGSIVFDHLFSTSGPKFGAAFDPAKYQEHDWGSLTLTLDCNGGTAHYTSTQAGFGSGDFTLTRLTALQKPACPYAQPKFSDLYDVTWDEIPIEPWTQQKQTFMTAASIADDGTIQGIKNGHLVLWHPATRIWEDTSPRLITGTPRISPDGLSVIATEDNGSDQVSPVQTLIWQRATGWQALPGSVLSRSRNTAISRNLGCVVGIAEDTMDGSPWVRSTVGVQTLLPMSEETMGGASPSAISDNCDAIVGSAPTETMGADVFSPLRVAIRWDNGGSPTILRNPDGEKLENASACNADCSIVFGDGIYLPPADQPHPEQAWYLGRDRAFGYLGILADASAVAHSYSVIDTTVDGSLAVGAYRTSDAMPAYAAFVWTQATGIVSVRTLISNLGIGDDNWTQASAVSVSSDGRKILLSGTFSPPPPDGQVHVPASRAVVLHLTPKASPD